MAGGVKIGLQVRPSRMDLAADRLVQYLRGPAFRSFMRGRALDLVSLQRALIDSRTLRPLSPSRIAQRVRNRVPHGPDHPLKATGQLHESLTGNSRAIAPGVVAAEVYARNTRRQKESSGRAGGRKAFHPNRGWGVKVTNPNLVKWHRDTGRDITVIPPQWVAEAQRLLRDEMRAVMARAFSSNSGPFQNVRRR